MSAPLAADQFYQVSFLVENAGKTISSTKKRVTWVFGQGDHEHTVTLVWSKQSGKRFVYMADAEIHFEEKKSVTFFHRWTSEDGKIRFHILATAASPSKKFVSPNFIKYELIINGERFAKLPHKDGTPAAEDTEANGLPGSIFDIIFPQGYHEKTINSEGPYRTKKTLSKEVSVRVAKQSTYNTHGGDQQ